MIAFPDLPTRSTVDEKSELIADWCEIVVLVEDRIIKRGDLAHDIPWGTDAVNMMERDAALEESVWSLLRRRRAKLGSSWPFQFNGFRLAGRRNYVGPARAVYTFMLLLSRNDLVKPSDRNVFEYMCVEIISNSTGSQGYRIGFPALRGEPTSFQGRISAYTTAARMAKFEIGHDVLPDDNDLGLDGVFWQPFVDRRSGAPHAWLQCATGRDWVNKTQDIHFGVISNHIKPAAGVIRMMAIPFIALPPESKWQRYATEAGIIFDRTRLAHLAKSSNLSEATLDAIRESLYRAWGHRDILLPAR
jgi:hypothetical protein